MKSVSFYALAACGLLTVIPLVSSCGGSQKLASSPTVAITGPGRATVSIAWPQPGTGRVIPLAAQSVRVRVFNSANAQVAEQLLVRPESNWWLTPTTATITGLPVDTVRVQAEAFPNPDGSGAVQARGATNTPVVAGDNPSLHLRLDSTVTSLTTNPVVVGVGQDTAYTVTARNADGDIVLESPDAYTSVGSSNPAVAAILPGFQVRAYTAGKTVITLYNKEAQKNIPLEVQALRTAEYRVVEVPTDWTSHFDGCRPTAINKNGSFVGYCYSGSINAPSAVSGFVADPNPSSATQPYTLKPLKTVAGYPQIYALDINDRGIVVGQAYNGSNRSVGFLRPSGAEDLIPLGDFGGSYTFAGSISNDATNTIVGASQSTDGNLYAFRYVGGNMSRLDNTPSWSEAYEINDKGDVAGARFETNFFFPNFWSASGTQSRTALNSNAYAYAINNQGQMAGFIAQQHNTEDSPAYPLFWSSRFGNPVRGLVPPSWGNNVRAFSINDNGLIVGSAAPSFTQTVKPRAVRWLNNKPEELNNLIPAGSAWDLKSAAALNNNGYVVGVGNLSGGPDRLYVLIPQDTNGGLQVGVD